jgi:Flp pilus assembly pilin Flp
MRAFLLALLRREDGLESVELAVLAGVIVAETVVMIVWFGFWVRAQLRRLGGQLDWDLGPGYSGGS